MQMGALHLPPSFHAIALRESGDAFAHAVAVAAAEGAGTLVHVGRFDLAEFAVVLEPVETLRAARLVFYAGMSALADALAAHAPPEKPIAFDWPDAILVDGALVGGARLAWPAATGENETPSWLVFGAMVRTAAREEPAGAQLGAALDQEGFDDLGRLIESFARHFMAALDAWAEEGSARLAKAYLARLSVTKGLRAEIADNGDLVLLRAGDATPARLSLIKALASPSWLDSSTGAPRQG
jgi:hypothetical protein